VELYKPVITYNQTTMTKTCNFIIEAGLICLIIFTPLDLGVVQVWAYTLMELVVLLMLTAWLLMTVP